MLVLKDQGVAIGMPVTVSSDDLRLPFDVSLKIEADENGVPVCTVLQCKRRPGGKPVTKTALAGLPLPAIIKEAVRRVATPLAQTDQGFELDLLDEPTERDVYAAFRRPRPATSHRVTDEHLRLVAEVYQLAVDQEDPAPTTRVAEVLYLTRPTAGRHVSEARKRGFLPPTKPGKKGTKGGEVK